MSGPLPVILTVLPVWLPHVWATSRWYLTTQHSTERGRPLLGDTLTTTHLLPKLLSLFIDIFTFEYLQCNTSWTFQNNGWKSSRTDAKHDFIDLKVTTNSKQKNKNKPICRHVLAKLRKTQQKKLNRLVTNEWQVETGPTADLQLATEARRHYLQNNEEKPINLELYIQLSYYSRMRAK